MASTADISRVDARAALDVLAQDGLVAFPTETVWGLAARADSSRALERLRAFKRRDADQPIAVMVDAPSRLSQIGVLLPSFAERIVEAFWPGPLTIVSKCRRGFAPGVARRDGAVGLRCSPHRVAAALAGGALDRGLGPLTATSLNRSGEQPARTIEEVVRALSADASIVVARGESGGGEPSTVVDLTGESLLVLREGAIPVRTLHQMQARSESVCS